MINFTLDGSEKKQIEGMRMRESEADRERRENQSRKEGERRRERQDQHVRLHSTEFLFQAHLLLLISAETLLSELMAI